MNRKGKIIVSVVGIFIVLLALVGITYGYFLTRIQGNTNTTSISVTTADLALVYDGDNGSIIGDNEVIEPDKTFTTKTFTVENKGNTTISNYAVILEGVSITDVTTGEAKPLNSTRDGKENDFDLVITCNDGDCNGYSDVLPEENAILVTNSIEPGEIHTYSATLKYIETNDDQSADMNKKITGKFNIIDTNDTANLSGTVTNMGDTKYYVQTNSTKRVSYIDNEGNYTILGLEAGIHTLKLCSISDKECESPVMKKEITVKTGTASANNTTGEITINNDYKNATININASGKSAEIIENIEFNNPYNKGTLAHNIINNVMSTGTFGYNKTIFIKPSEQDGITYSKPAEQISKTDERIMSFASYDGGTSYYYRGNVEDNYMNYAGMCWKIVRIDGDGSVKLILEDQYTECDDTNDNDKNKDSLVYTGAWNIPASDGTNLTIDTSTGKAYRTGNFGYKYSSDITTFTEEFIMSYLNPNQYPERSMVNAFKYFQNNNLNNYLGNLKGGNWCNNDSGYSDTTGTNKINKVDYYNRTINDNFYYDAYVRLEGKTIKEPTYNCNGTILDEYSDKEKMYVATLTADEITYAGGKAKSYNENYFLLNSYQKTNTLSFWTFSPSWWYGNFDLIYFVGEVGIIFDGRVDNDYYSFRPSIVLESDAQFKGGTGVQSMPYEIKMD